MQQLSRPSRWKFQVGKHALLRLVWHTISPNPVAVRDGRQGFVSEIKGANNSTACTDTEIDYFSPARIVRNYKYLHLTISHIIVNMFCLYNTLLASFPEYKHGFEL